MMLIGLTGAAFAGKDTVGNYLADMHEFELHAFADPLRAGLIAMFGLTKDDFAPQNKERAIEWLGTSPRRLMQTLGTEWGRHLVASDLWCRAMEQRLALSRRFHVAAIAITDVRFADEAALIRRLGGSIWRIERPGAGTTAHGGHISETAGQAIEADSTLINDGTVEQLYEQVDATLDLMMQADGIEAWAARQVAGVAL